MSTPEPQPPLPPENPDKPEVVYRRVELSGFPRSFTELNPIRKLKFAPAITPLIIGFTLLLALVSLLGYLSVHWTDDVGFRVRDLETRHAARLGLLLKLRLAVTKLNNEARARQEAESRKELKPPFGVRLSAARDDVRDLLKELERPPLSEDPSWRQFKTDLQSYVAVTEDERRYNVDEGFTRFRVVDTELNDLLDASQQEQEQIVRQSEAIEQEAARSIRFWSLIALLVGAVVAAGTIWEVQRRFRQTRHSMRVARRERAFTNQLLEGMVSAVAAIDQDDRIRSANAAFFNIFPAASIGASVYEKFGADDAMRMLEAATATRVAQAAYRGRWVCKDQEGKEKTYDVYSSPLAIDGAQGQIITLVDATEAAESERLVRRTESLAAVGQATAQVAHEIRNPLGSIRLGVSMLRDSVTDQEALDTIELVERGIKHLNKLVVDVTQFSRRKPLERVDVDINELIDMSLNLVADRIKDKHTPVQKKLMAEPVMGHWDADQLRQVLVNLIANAVDASAVESPIVISTEVVNISSDHGSGAQKKYARITVSDYGKGIEKPALDRIFEPFYSTKKRGTGLGLAIVKQIVEQHGGRVAAESNLGQGASFMIDLPLQSTS